MIMDRRDGPEHDTPALYRTDDSKARKSDGMTLQGAIEALLEFSDKHPELASEPLWMEGCDCAGLFSGIVVADGIGGVIMTRLD